MDVVTAARARIRNIFSNGVPVYLSFSGGKDSLVLAHLVFDMIERKEISPSLLTVQFIDEEAIYPCIERTVLEWRKRFLMVGAKFEWYCVEVRHHNCFNELEQDESFICWDRTKEEVWVRRPPRFAIRKHPLLRPRVDTYQDFCARIDADGLQLIGMRVAESYQRLDNFARHTTAGRKLSAINAFFPIYDWKDNDVWLYLYQHGVQIPDVYLYLWQSGSSLRNLRVSQFFSVDTARSLVKMNEYYPDLMERVVRREPNAYLAALYWDSEMFRRNTIRRRRAEKSKTEKIDYKKRLMELFADFDANFNTPYKRRVARRYRNTFRSIHPFASEKDFRRMYEALVTGDPKQRVLRSIFPSVFASYADRARSETGRKGFK